MNFTDILDGFRSFWTAYSDSSLISKILTIVFFLLLACMFIIYGATFFAHYSVGIIGQTWRVHLVYIQNGILEPIDGAILCQVAGKRGDTPNILAYELSVKVKGKGWVNLDVINLPKKAALFHIPHALDNANQIEFFYPNNFDDEIWQRNLQPGEMAVGWIYYRFPKGQYNKYINGSPELYKIKFEDPQKRIETLYLKPLKTKLRHPVPEHWGYAVVGCNQDLSRYKYDLLDYKIKSEPATSSDVQWDYSKPFEYSVDNNNRILIHAIQIKGTNISDHNITNMSGYFLSNITKGGIGISLSGVPIENTKQVAPKTSFLITSYFREPVTLEWFSNEFADFSFNFFHDKKKFEKHFSAADVIQMIDELKAKTKKRGK
jgi:hypothetical protein